MIFNFLLPAFRKAPLKLLHSSIWPCQPQSILLCKVPNSTWLMWSWCSPNKWLLICVTVLNLIFLPCIKKSIQPFLDTLFSTLAPDLAREDTSFLHKSEPPEPCRFVFFWTNNNHSLSSLKRKFLEQFVEIIFKKLFS